MVGLHSTDLLDSFTSDQITSIRRFWHLLSLNVIFEVLDSLLYKGLSLEYGL
uniref:Uncharacterized protein n=1 Tax=Picea sitchensis TaxID=3332 RepID=A9NPE6_PICSI|nr:unknown [Picea sitchensis]